MNQSGIIMLAISQMVYQLAAAYLSYRIYKFNRVNKGWLMVTIALILMAVGRIFAVVLLLGWANELPPIVAFIDSLVLPFLISVFLLIGLYSMFRNFVSFDIVEKNVQDKIKNFKKK